MKKVLITLATVIACSTTYSFAATPEKATAPAKETTAATTPEKATEAAPTKTAKTTMHKHHASLHKHHAVSAKKAA